MRSSESADPGLHTGLAYFVEDRPYKTHVLKHATQEDVSVTHNLIVDFLTPFSHRSAPVAASKLLLMLKLSSALVFGQLELVFACALVTKLYVDMELEISKRENGTFP